MITGYTKHHSPHSLLNEWLVTNGLGGYASGTIGGTCMRRFHGKLVAAMPAPLGRTMMLNHLEEWLSGSDGLRVELGGGGALELFALECGIPLWRYSAAGIRLEKRVVMPYGQNTVCILYQLLDGPADLKLHLRPSVNFRPHEGLLSEAAKAGMRVNGRQVEIYETRELPTLRLALVGDNAKLHEEPRAVEHVLYSLERDRGYEHEGPLWSPGTIEIDLTKGHNAGLIASVESWDVIHAMTMAEVLEADRIRRHRML
ncbi:MAG: glycogen debranching enzyme N-terminal domain-containing protein, partial [Thermoanaerobaculia bacterium]